MHRHKLVSTHTPHQSTAQHNTARHGKKHKAQAHAIRLAFCRLQSPFYIWAASTHPHPCVLASLTCAQLLGASTLFWHKLKQLLQGRPHFLSFPRRLTRAQLLKAQAIFLIDWDTCG